MVAARVAGLRVRIQTVAIMAQSQGQHRGIGHPGVACRRRRRARATGRGREGWLSHWRRRRACQGVHSRD